METRPSPTRSHERIFMLDVLRGFAIFGILMVNIMWYNSPIASLISNNSLWTEPADIVTRFFITTFFEGKFYVLFSMLFGYGFWLFINKRQEDGKPLSGLFARRLLVLLFFGAAHILLLWPGDILLFYALAGFILMLFRKVRNESLILWALVFIMIPVVFLGLAVLISLVPEAKLAMEESFRQRDLLFLNQIENAISVYREGTFMEMMRMRLQEYSLVLGGVLFFHVNILGMFLFGQFAARKGYVKNLKEHLPMFRKLCFWGFIAGIPINLFTAWASLFSDIYFPSNLSLLAMFLSAFGGPALTLAYVSGIIILYEKGYFSRLWRYLSSVGRMALTNYLLHSIIASFIFYSYGLGLYAKVVPWQGLILVLIIYGLQIPFSMLWLKHFRYGPFEWLWRSLTYLKWQRFKN